MIYYIESEPFHCIFRQYIYRSASVEPGILLSTCPSHRNGLYVACTVQASIHSFLILTSRQDICYNRNPRSETMSPMVTSRPNVLQCYIIEASIHPLLLIFPPTHLPPSQSQVKSHPIFRRLSPRCSAIAYDFSLDLPLFLTFSPARLSLLQNQATAHIVLKNPRLE